MVRTRSACATAAFLLAQLAAATRARAYVYNVTVVERDPIPNDASLISRINGTSAFNYSFNTAWFGAPSGTGAPYADGLIVRVVECNANHHSCAGVAHPEWTNAGALVVVGASLGGAGAPLTTQYVNTSTITWAGASAPPHGGTVGLWGAADPRIAYRNATGEYFLTWDNCTQNCFPHRTTLLSTTTDPFDGSAWTFHGALLGANPPYTGGASLLLQDQPPHFAFVSNSDTANAINVATSADGYSWAFNASSQGPWMGGRPGMWDASGVAPGPQPERLSTGDYLFIYNIDTGFPYKPSYLGRCSIGWAVLDGSNPLNILARADVPLLTPQIAWETCGGEGGKGPWPMCQEPEVVFSTGLKPLGDDKFLLIYGAADSVVGVATIAVSTK